MTKRSAENSVGDSLEYYSQVPKSVLQQAVEQVYVPKAPSYYFTGSAKSERRYLSVRYARPKFSCCVFIKCKMSPDIAEEIESVEGVRGMMKMPEGFVAPMDQEQQKMIEEMVATPPPEMPVYMKEIQMGEYVSIVGGTEAGKYGIVEGVQSNRLAVRVRSEGKEDTIESIAITDVRYLPNPPEKHYRLLTSKEMLQMLLERDPKNPQIRTLLRTGAGADLINAQAELGPPMPYLRGSLERDSNRDRPRNGGDRRDDFRNDRRPDNNRRDGGFNNRERNNRDGSFGTRSSYTRDGEMRSSNMQSKANDNRNNKREESAKSSIDHDLLSWMNDDPKPNKETSSPSSSWGVGDDIKSNPATNSKKSKKDDFEDYDENEVIWAGATDEFSAKYFQQPEENEEPASKTKQTKDKVDDFDRMFGLDDDSDLYDYEGSSARSTKASTAKNTVSRSVQNTVASKPDSNKDGAPQPQDFQNFADYINALVAYQKGGKNSAGVANVMSQGSNRATDSLRKASKEVMETTNTGDYDNLQVKDMKRLLKDQGLSQTGNKDELRSRLIQNKVPIV